MELAISLNGFLASPSFQAWTEGDALDPQAMLWTPDGQPRHTVFYLAHLTDQERMFFVTLLLSAVEAWMRAQAGSSSLRALIYFDGVLGFLPPVKEPPSKAAMMRLLKQQGLLLKLIQSHLMHTSLCHWHTSTKVKWMMLNNL